MRSGINRLFGRDRDKPTVGEAWNAYKRMRHVEERQPVLSHQAEAMWDRVVGGTVNTESWRYIPAIVLGHSRLYCPTCAPSFDRKPRSEWSTIPSVFGDGYSWGCVLCLVNNLEQPWRAECSCCRLPRLVTWELMNGRPVPPRE